MCMETVDAKPKRKSGTGYKILRYMADELSTGYRHGDSQLVKIGVPVKDDSNMHIFCKDDENRNYDSGFHLFLTKRAVRKFQIECGWTRDYLAIVRAKFSRVVATGTQLGNTVVIAKEFTATEVLQYGGILK